jgi:cytoskeleton protein RodZ
MDDAAAAPGIPPQSPAPAGDALRTAREARGLSLEEVAARTRIPLRHLQAIERSVYTELPSPTYAVGFSKAFARAVGADEVAVAARVRVELTRLGRRQPEYQPYVVADPARVPGRWLAIAGIGAAVAILVFAVLWFGTMRSGGSSPGGVSSAPAPIASAPVPAATAATPAGGQVTLVATDEVWLRVHDADGKRLYLGTMKPGERFDVPAGANGPMIDVGRPDKLQLTLNGSAVPALGTGERPIKDVRVDAAAIARRLAGAPSAETAGSAPTPAASPTPRRTTAARPAPRLTETQRANLASAAAARAGGQP